MQSLERGVRLHDGDLVFSTGTGGRRGNSTQTHASTLATNSSVRVYGTGLDRMYFDVERGEAEIESRSLADGASLVIHTPPGMLTIRKAGHYRFRVGANGETEADVARGELRYTDERGKVVRVKGGRKVSSVGSGAKFQLATRYGKHKKYFLHYMVAIFNYSTYLHQSRNILGRRSLLKRRSTCCPSATRRAM